MADNGLIGVVGGMGPYAGVDLVKKIFDETMAARDQDHLPVALVSVPHRIADRSAYLNGRTQANPAEAILGVLRDLDGIGARVAGIPCNTAHHRRIFEPMVDALTSENRSVKLLNIVTENARYIREQMPGVTTVGVLATSATIQHRIYADILEAEGFRVVVPAEGHACNQVNEAIFSESFGIKAFSNPVTETARDILRSAVADLHTRGAEAVILGCTELPLAVPEADLKGVPLIDSTRVLARALIRETAPDKLRPVRRIATQPA